MGVSCTAYEVATLMRECQQPSDADWDEMERDGSHYLKNWAAEFEPRGDGMPSGFYNLSGLTERYDASYGGYNEFRRQLCKAVNGMKPERIWGGPPALMRLPFAPLIHFSDCEGFLGPKTCARLAADAGEYPDLTIERFDRDEWATWRRMFKIAAHTGVVVFS